MPTSTFTLKAHSFRIVPTPLEAQGIRTHTCIVPTDALPTEFRDNWMEVNAREPSITGRVPNAIRGTLENAPENFVAFNRGLAILADTVEWDNQTREVKLSFQNKEFHGIFDGGHTLAVILDWRNGNLSNDEETQDTTEAFCRLEIMTGVPPEMITDLVDARNTSRQVASKSILNLEGRFAPLKAALGPQLSNLVVWKENQDGLIDVREVIALLTALDRTHYDDTKHPLIAYSGKEACLKHFENSPSCYEKLYPIAKDALKLWDLIQAEVPAQYTRDQGGRFGKLKGCNPLRHERDLPVIGGTIEYLFPRAYILPIVAAFRSMLVEENGIYIWGKGVDPCRLVREGLANKIFSGPVVNSIKDYHNPNRTGKDTNVWALSYQIAENHYLRI